ncbi:hypothetical protein CRD60_06840 [Bifidobacterium aemilianum]|uniref:Acyltransferase 3 domain-containing protein n=1 Tax=Bifidobacterium aemilianum TaxID=2493120 RepID=A0A366K6W3_9BIFI|nr:acyltransferase [Bifidobacterium aemilianum]RBP97475.1 hypothetical protein CRD60_06840 [Bifidobacterium aemilianum]
MPTEAARVRTRNSSFELLRIIAMIMIVFMHDIANGNFYTGRSFPVDAIIRIIKNFGSVGDCLFFGITGWFLCMAPMPKFKKSARKAWLLERQLLFYTYLIYFVFLCFQLTGFYRQDSEQFFRYGVKTIIPTISAMWWYPTSYILFLLLYPWINRGLRALGRTSHGRLALLVFIIWGLIPYFHLNLGGSVWLFLYLYVLISYLRWYHDDLLLSAELSHWLFGIGMSLMVIGNIIGAKWFPGRLTTTMLGSARFFPTLFVSLAMLMWAYRTSQDTPKRRSESTDRFINLVASCTLAPYLLLVHPWMVHFIEKKLHFVLVGNPWKVLAFQFILPPIFFTIGVFIDFARQLLFKLTVDRRPGRLFDRLWAAVQSSKYTSIVRQFLDGGKAPVSREKPPHTASQTDGLCNVKEQG